MARVVSGVTIGCNGIALSFFLYRLNLTQSFSVRNQPHTLTTHRDVANLTLDHATRHPACICVRVSAAQGATAFTKRLVLDFETLKTQLGGIANLEGITFGPRLANGKRSLVVIADDNFPLADLATDRNQVIVFEIQP
jgi:hypothetical protein